MTMVRRCFSIYEFRIRIPITNLKFLKLRAIGRKTIVLKI
jgi:hypothetical protein